MGHTYYLILSYILCFSLILTEVEDTPGAGNYQIARNILHNESPAYSMKQQLKTVESEFLRQ